MIYLDVLQVSNELVRAVITEPPTHHSLQTAGFDPAPRPLAPADLRGGQEDWGAGCTAG